MLVFGGVEISWAIPNQTLDEALLDGTRGHQRRGQDAVGSSCWFLCFFRNGNKKGLPKKRLVQWTVLDISKLNMNMNNIFLWQRNCRLTLVVLYSYLLDLPLTHQQWQMKVHCDSRCQKCHVIVVTIASWVYQVHLFFLDKKTPGALAIMIRWECGGHANPPRKRRLTMQLPTFGLLGSHASRWFGCQESIRDCKKNRKTGSLSLAKLERCMRSIGFGLDGYICIWSLRLSGQHFSGCGSLLCKKTVLAIYFSLLSGRLPATLLSHSADPGHVCD